MQKLRILLCTLIMMLCCSLAMAAGYKAGTYSLEKGSVDIELVKIEHSPGGSDVDGRMNLDISYNALMQLYKVLPQPEADYASMREDYDRVFAGADAVEKSRELLEDAAGFAAYLLRRDALAMKAAGGSNVDFTLSSRPEVHFRGDNILSIEQQGYIFTGGAHGISFIQTMNYDPKTGRPLMLKDLFVPGSGYLRRLDKAVNAQAAVMGLYAPIEVKEDDKFFISSSGDLVLVYAPGEAAYYAAGRLAFAVPAETLADILAVEIK